MASAAMLRSAARSPRLRQPLEQQRCLLARRFLSSSVPTERNTCPSSSEQKSHVNEKTEDIYKRLMIKIDKVSNDMDEHLRLIKQLNAQIEENDKHRGAIDLTPWVVSMSSSFLLFALYKYVYY